MRVTYSLKASTYNETSLREGSDSNCMWSAEK